MEYQCTFAFALDWTDHEDFKTAINKIKLLKDLILKKQYSTYDFIGLQNDSVLSSAEQIETKFNEFINYLEQNFKWQNSEKYGDYFEIEPGPYSSETIDLEDGEYEFSQTFNITDTNIIIYLTSIAWYASEINKWTNQGIGIGVEVVDLDGDYQWFDV